MIMSRSQYDESSKISRVPSRSGWHRCGAVCAPHPCSASACIWKKNIDCWGSMAARWTCLIAHLAQSSSHVAHRIMHSVHHILHISGQLTFANCKQIAFSNSWMYCCSHWWVINDDPLDVQVWSQMRCHTLPGRVYTLLHSGHVGHAFNNWHVIRFRVLLTFARVRDLTWVHKICLTPIKSEDLRNNFKIPPRYIQKRNLKDTLIGVVNAWFYSALREHIERHIQERRPFNTLVANNDLNE